MCSNRIEEQYRVAINASDDAILSICLNNKRVHYKTILLSRIEI